jgi:heterodisulfide reductase subunit B2
VKYAYYPGCSSHSTAKDMHESCVTVAKALGIELEEIKGWSCCGATAAHNTSRLLADSLPSANLVLAKEMGLDMVVTCAACYSRMKAANYEIKNSEAMRKQVAEATGKDYDGSVKVRHFIEVLLEDVGLKKLQKSFKKSLNDLKVASYYGCYLVRPHEVTGFDDPENPTTMDRLVESMGGINLDWPHKVECCGGGLNLTRTDVVVELSRSIIDVAKESGADCIAVACPMCQASLDLRQKDMEKKTGQKYEMPVLYITQMVGLCMGLSEKELGLGRPMISPSAVVKAVGAKA